MNIMMVMTLPSYSCAPAPSCGTSTASRPPRR